MLPDVGSEPFRLCGCPDVFRVIPYGNGIDQKRLLRIIAGCHVSPAKGRHRLFDILGGMIVDNSPGTRCEEVLLGLVEEVTKSSLTDCVTSGEVDVSVGSEPITVCEGYDGSRVWMWWTWANWKVLAPPTLVGEFVCQIGAVE